MRYNVTFNQLELMAYNERNPTRKIDFKDAIILQQLWHLSTWGEVEKIDLSDGQYFWVAYGKLNTELPCLGFKTNETLGKRIKAKLLKTGLLKLHVNWKDNSKTYWQFTEAGSKIAEPGKDPSRSHDGTRGGRTTEREGVAPPNERGSHGGTDNYNTSDSFTKDEREKLSHFQFFKRSYPKECTEWRKKYEKRIFNHVDFLNGFNNKMILTKFPKTDLIITRIDEYARQYIRNQKEAERPAPYHRKPKNFM